MADESIAQRRNDVLIADDQLNRLRLCSDRLVLDKHLYFSLDLVALLDCGISLIPGSAHMAKLLNKLVNISVVYGAYRLFNAD